MCDDLVRPIAIGLILFAVFVPLGIWKAIEIVIWLIKHVRVGVE
jgi:hypothetical protein